MRKLYLVITSVVIGFACMVANPFIASVSFDAAKQVVSYECSFDNDLIKIEFKKCMANELYTFSSVSLNDVVVNKTESDNIGPFLVSGFWLGGNHLAPDGTKTAKTDSVHVKIDGQYLTPDAAVNGLPAEVLEIDVYNTLYYSDRQTFCKEHVNYSVSGNSIEVEAVHDYCYPKPLTIDRYYGMQSMFCGETEVLLPGMPLKGWYSLEKIGDKN